MNLLGPAAAMTTLCRRAGPCQPGQGLARRSAAQPRRSGLQPAPAVAAHWTAALAPAPLRRPPRVTADAAVEVQDGASVPDFYLVTRALGLRAGDCVLFKPRTASAHHFDVDAWRPRPDGGRQRLELVCSAVERQLARLFDPRCSKALCKADLQTVGLPCVMRREGGVFHDALEAVEPNQPLRLFYGLEELDCLEVSIYINRSTYALRSSGRLIQALGLREGDLLVFRPRPAAPGPTHFAVKAWRPGPNGRLSRLGPTEGSKQLRASRVPRSQVVVADGGAAAAPISTARGQGPPCAAADELRLSVTRTALGPSAGVGVPYSAVTSFFGVADPWAPRPEETLKLEPVAQDPRRLIKAVSLSAAKCRYGKVLWRLTGLPPWLRSIGAAVDDVLVLRRMGGGPGPSAGGSSCRYALRLELQGGDRVPGGGGAEPDAYGGTESRASAPTEPCGTERTSAGARAASAAAPVARATLAAAARDSPPRPARVETDSSVRGPSSTSQRQAAAQAAPRQGVVPGAVAPQPLPGSQAPPKRSAAEAGGVRMRATVSGGARTPAANPAGSSSSTSDSDSDDIPLAKRRRTGHGQAPGHGGGKQWHGGGCGRRRRPACLRRGDPAGEKPGPAPDSVLAHTRKARLAVTTGGGFCLRGLEPLLTALKAGPGDVLLLEPVGAGASVGRAFRVELWRSGPWPPPPPPIQAVAPAAAAAPRPLFALPAGAAGTGPGGGLTSQKPLACSVVVTSKMLAGGYLRLHPAFVTDLGLAPSPPSAGAAAAAAAAPLPPAAPLTLRVVDGAEGCGTGGGLVAATLSAARGKSGGKVLWSLEGLGTWMAARGAVEGTVVRLSGPTGGQGRGEVTIALAEPTPSASAFPWGLPAPDGARF
ncbi:hypothetical protein HYH03_007384 [Edaphochlamys debaryana]|uniref:Uncharacterized protein n=1 Tax=Edaphochlamys debaryana TaxID=47281 RepID=A0A835Y1R6_9CHLO|nr:hypothetical protein HYH03_007384 [Edaphochlamys debaryana]|eukprot:KAG2494326.1 hypothetical protein HYH03_007384 [Edaphochlamys debaryana]